MADNRPLAPTSNTGAAPSAPTRTISGNNYLVNKARAAAKPVSKAMAPKKPIQEGMPVGSTMDAVKLANNLNALPDPQQTYAGEAQLRAEGPQNEQQAKYSGQAQSNMGGSRVPQTKGLLQRLAFQLPGRGQYGV